MRYEKDEKRIVAFEELKKLGILIPVDENLKLYHGRAGNWQDEWEVDPNLDNGGEHDGHRNMYQIPVLSTTTDRDAAERYALLRSENAGLPELHRIIPYKEGSYIINVSNSDNQLSTDQRKAVTENLRELSMFSVSELAPVKF